MGRRERITFVNRYFYPDHSPTSELLSDVAFALAERGFEVSAITSRQRYDVAKANLAKGETVRGVDVKRVWTSRHGRTRLAARSIDYLTFYVAAAWHLLRSAQRGDVIVAKTDPPLLSVVLAPIAKLKGAHLVNWLQDVFPEVAEKLNIGGFAGRLLRQSSNAHSKLVSQIRQDKCRRRRGHGCTSRSTRDPSQADHRDQQLG